MCLRISGTFTFRHYSEFPDLISSIVIDIKELLWYQKSAARTRDKVGAVSLYPHVPGSTKSFPHRDVTLLSVPTSTLPHPSHPFPIPPMELYGYDCLLSS